MLHQRVLFFSVVGLVIGMSGSGFAYSLTNPEWDTACRSTDVSIECLAQKLDLMRSVSTGGLIGLALFPSIAFVGATKGDELIVKGENGDRILKVDEIRRLSSSK